MKNIFYICDCYRKVADIFDESVSFCPCYEIRKISKDQGKWRFITCMVSLAKASAYRCGAVYLILGLSGTS